MRSNYRFISCWPRTHSSMAIVFWSACVAVTQTAAQGYTLDEVRSSYAAAHDQLQSLFVAYRIRHDAQRGGHVTQGKMFTEEFAFSGEKQFRFRGSWVPNPDGKSSEWMERVFWFDGDRTTEMVTTTSKESGPDIQPAAIVRGRSDAKLNASNYYMDAIGAPHYEGKYSMPWRSQRMEPTSVRFRLRDGLKDGQYAVEKTTATLGGQSCVMLRNKYDTVWLCPAYNWAIAKREWVAHDGSGLLFRIENSSFAQTANSLWCPQKSVVKFYTANARGAPDRVSVDWTRRVVMDVTSIRINEVRDSRFEAMIPTGLDVMDASIIAPTSTGTPVVEYVKGGTPAETQKGLDVALGKYQESRGSSLVALGARYGSIILCMALAAAVIWLFVTQRLSLGN